MSMNNILETLKTKIKNLDIRDESNLEILPGAKLKEMHNELKASLKQSTFPKYENNEEVLKGLSIVEPKKIDNTYDSNKEKTFKDKLYDARINYLRNRRKDIEDLKQLKKYKDEIERAFKQSTLSSAQKFEEELKSRSEMIDEQINALEEKIESFDEYENKEEKHKEKPKSNDITPLDDQKYESIRSEVDKSQKKLEENMAKLDSVLDRFAPKTYNDFADEFDRLVEAEREKNKRK